MNRKLLLRINKTLEPIYPNIDKIGIFGSYLYNPTYANDIDIMVWVKRRLIRKCIKSMSSLEAYGSLNVEKLHCHYTNLPEVKIDDDDKKESELPIHITWLPTDEDQHNRCKLWNRNKDNVKIIYSRTALEDMQKIHIN